MVRCPKITFTEDTFMAPTVFNKCNTVFKKCNLGISKAELFNTQKPRSPSLDDDGHISLYRLQLAGGALGKQSQL